MEEQRFSRQQRMGAAVAAAVCLAFAAWLVTIDAPRWPGMALFPRLGVVTAVGMVGFAGFNGYIAWFGVRRQPVFNRAVALLGGAWMAAFALTFIRTAAEVPEPIVASTLQSIGYLFVALTAVALLLHVMEEQHRALRRKLDELESRVRALTGSAQP